MNNNEQKNNDERFTLVVLALFSLGERKEQE